MCSNFGCGVSFRAMLLVNWCWHATTSWFIKSPLHWRYYAEACNDCRGLPLLLSAWAIQKRRSNGELLATLPDLTSLEIDPTYTRWRRCPGPLRQVFWSTNQLRSKPCVSQVRRERVRLHDMVEYHNKMKIDVLRCLDGQLKQVEVWSKDLVPGDVLVIPPGGVQLPCDAALISGRNFSTNKSQKTGCLTTFIQLSSSAV